MNYVTFDELFALITLLLTVAGFSASAVLTVVMTVIHTFQNNNKKK